VGLNVGSFDPDGLPFEFGFFDVCADVGFDVVGLDVVGLDVGLDVVGLDVVGLDVVGLDVVGFEVVRTLVTLLTLAFLLGFTEEKCIKH
jgi:hypothetical protein